MSDDKPIRQRRGTGVMTSGELPPLTTSPEAAALPASKAAPEDLKGAMFARGRRPMDDRVQLNARVPRFVIVAAKIQAARSGGSVQDVITEVLLGRQSLDTAELEWALSEAEAGRLS